MKYISKEETLRILFNCSKIYRKELMNRNLLFIYTDGKSINSFEVTFNDSNFLHLTGVKTKLSATDFIDRCYYQRLSRNDFEIPNDGTVTLKLSVLPQLISKNLSAKIVGDFAGNRIKLNTERLAGNIYGCIGFIKDKNNYYVPNTVLQEDIRSNSTKTYKILLTYRKNKKNTAYSEIVYAAKKVDWSSIELPEEYRNLPLPKRTE